jgi:membrane protein YdbS with pleckstrin-like domain
MLNIPLYLPTRAFADSRLNRLLLGLGQIVVVVMMMVTVVYYHNHLRLRRIRYCETEDENQSKPKLFHTLLSRVAG